MAKAADAELAAGVLVGDDSALRRRAGARGVGPRGHPRPQRHDRADVQSLRDAGFDDDQIMAVTVFVALRVAFSTVNDALGAVPDPNSAGLPAPIADAVTWGRR